MAGLLNSAQNTLMGLLNTPTKVQQFLTNPQAFLGLLGQNRLPNATGFAAGATGLPMQTGSVLDPNQVAYERGYSSGEPVGYAAMASPMLVPAARALAPKAGQMAENYMMQQGMMPAIAPQSKTALSTSRVGEFDPRFDNRMLEQEKLRSLTTTVEGQRTPAQQKVSLVDYEGRPFITSMSDRTAAGGELVNINDVSLNRPVGLLGGQDYMFNNPGQVWASDQRPVKQILNLAENLKQATGQNPLYLPWRMSPSGGDYANMTYETMLNYAQSAMSKTDKKELNKTIKEYIPDWKGIDSKESIQQFRDTPDSIRKIIMNEMDVKFRDAGGLSIGEARLAVADPKQLQSPVLDIMNVGEIYADQPMIMQSGHPSYPRGIPGQGLGIIDQPRTIFDLLPNVTKERQMTDPSNWSQADRRAMEMKPYGGLIDADLLKSLGY